MTNDMGQRTELHVFAGAGGGILAGELLGHKPVCAVEIDEYCRRVLKQRQDDGILPGFPIWDDVTTFDGRPWRGLVDIVSGGFPCTNTSIAGDGSGIDGAKSGLWSEMFRVVREVRPGLVWVENSPMLTSRGLGRVVGDLASVGFDAEWCVRGARHSGAPHWRDRIWMLAYACSQRLEAGGMARGLGSEVAEPACRIGWPPAPAVCRVDDGVADRVGQIRALGNGQVPRVGAAAFRLLSARLGIAP